MTTLGPTMKLIIVMLLALLAPILSARNSGNDALISALSTYIANIDNSIYKASASTLETYENGKLLEVISISNENLSRIQQNLPKLTLYLNKVKRQQLNDPTVGVSLDDDFSSATSEEASHQQQQKIEHLTGKVLLNHAHVYLSYRMLSQNAHDVLLKCRFKTKSDAHRRIVIELHQKVTAIAVLNHETVRLAIDLATANDIYNDSNKSPCLLISGPTRQEMETIMDDAVIARTRTKLGQRVQIFNDIVAPLAENLTTLQAQIEALEIATLFGDVKELEKSLRNAHINFLMMQSDMLKLGDRLTFVKEKVTELTQNPTNLDIFVDLRRRIKEDIGGSVNTVFKLMNQGSICSVENLFHEFVFTTSASDKENVLAVAEINLAACYDAKLLAYENAGSHPEIDALTAKTMGLAKNIEQATYYMRKH